MIDRHTAFERFRAERSAELAAAVDITPCGITITYYDLRLSRSVSRAIFQGGAVSAQNVAQILGRAFSAAGRELGVNAAAIKSVGFAAPVHISAFIEDALSAQELFLRPETHLFVMPYISAGISGRFTSALLTLPEGECCAAELADSLCVAHVGGGEVRCASFGLCGAFSASGLESGMLHAAGAVDSVTREHDGTLCYSVSGDTDGVGLSAAGAAMALRVMLDEGIIDADGIMTDRDMLYIGEDIFVSQRDVRAFQSDRARCAAALEVFSRRYGGRFYFSGEPFTREGFAALLATGVIPEELRGAGFAQGAVTSGIIRCFDPAEYERAERLAAGALDVTEELAGEVGELYYERLAFPEKG